ncbi:Sensor protein FixL [subsurface metagenome]
MANKHGKAKAQGGGKIKVADKANEQLIEEIERLRQEVDKLRQEETERKRVETALQESEARYRTILENVVEGYYEVDLAGNFTFVNDSICHNLGYSRDELLSMNNRDYMDKQTAKKVYQKFSEAYTTGQPARGVEFEVTRKDGTKLVAACSASLIMDAKGQPTGFRGVVRDITERKQAEETLRESEERYRTILESIEHGYFEVDIRGNLTFFNDSMCEIIGYPRDEMMGMNNRKYMEKENARKVYQTFNRVYTTGKPDRGFDWEIIRKDGTKRTVEASVSLVRDSKGKPTGFRGIVRDLTERRKAEAEKKALEQQAQVASRLSTMGEMASGIIHEINNPLASVVGFAEMLAQKKDLPEDAREYATIINNEGKRVASIASRLLSFARHQKPETVYTDINKLIEDTIELQTYEMTTGNIKVTTELDPHLPQTMADPGQLQQVFLNIMLNARKEMRAAHGGGKLLVKTQALDGAIQISLKDDGPGIRQKNLERIFDPFFTTKKAREGTGLGLSICQGIITSHNGKIYARSRSGKGATFIIELPVVARQRKTTQAGSAIDKPRRPAMVRR